MFTFSEKSGSNSLGHEDSFFGISLLVMYLACDSFTSQWQSKVFKMHSIDQYEMMLGNNIWALFLTGNIINDYIYIYININYIYIVYITIIYRTIIIAIRRRFRINGIYHG